MRILSTMESVWFWLYFDYVWAAHVWHALYRLGLWGDLHWCGFAGERTEVGWVLLGSNEPEGVKKSRQVGGRVRKKRKKSESFKTCRKWSKSVEKCWKESIRVEKFWKWSKSVEKCWEKSKIVEKLRNVSKSLENCRKVTKSSRNGRKVSKNLHEASQAKPALILAVKSTYLVWPWTVHQHSNY